MSDYGYNCAICDEPILEADATEHTIEGLAHLRCTDAAATPREKKLQKAHGKEVQLGRCEICLSASGDNPDATSCVERQETGLAPCAHCGERAYLESGFVKHDKVMGYDLFYAEAFCINRVLCGARMSLYLNNEPAARDNVKRQWNHRVPLAPASEPKSTDSGLHSPKSAGVSQVKLEAIAKRKAEELRSSNAIRYDPVLRGGKSLIETVILSALKEAIAFGGNTKEEEN